MTDDLNKKDGKSTQEQNSDALSFAADAIKKSRESALKKAKTKKRWRTFLKYFFYVSFIGFVLGSITLFAIFKWAQGDLPSFSKIADYRPAQVTTVLARDGSLIGQFYREKRYVIGLNEMAPHVPLAFLAVEDSDFYQHPGVNFVAILRAFIANIQSGSIKQGGSTITQQVVKRLMQIGRAHV